MLEMLVIASRKEGSNADMSATNDTHLNACFVLLLHAV